MSEYKYETLHNCLLQDKEMTVRRDCDQRERVFLQNIPHLLVNTESLLSLLLFIFLKVMYDDRMTSKYDERMWNSVFHVLYVKF